VLYVEELAGPDTVNTAPRATIDAFRDHGRPEARLERDLGAAEDELAALAEAGVDLDAVTDDLLEKGLALFGDAFEKLLSALESRRAASLRS
jgi:transaldolase/glucose-6-phosphate isomerase